AVQPEELAGGVLNISGAAQKVSDGVWNVGGIELRVDEKTFGSEQLEAGATANFVVARSASGHLHALSLSTVKKDTPPTEALVSGEGEEVDKDRIRVPGQGNPVNTATLI